jgi:hypothetical protein
MAAVFIGLCACAAVWQTMSAPVLGQSQRGLSSDDLMRIDARCRNLLTSLEQPSPSAVADFVAEGPLKGSAAVKTLQSSLERDLPQFGRPLGTEQVRLERISTSLLRTHYLYRCDKFPVVFTFTFYRSTAEGNWQPIHVRFHAEYDKLPATEERP